MRYRPVHRPESLEPRLVLAGMLSFVDVDGDIATVRSTLGTDGDLVAAVALTPAGVGFQLTRVDLTAPVFAGTRLRINAAPNGGDGLVHVGEIVSPLDLRAVVLGGDLAKITVGDADPITPAIQRLAVRSMGRFGTATGAPDTTSLIFGSIGALEVGFDMEAMSLAVTDGIASATVGGSIIGVNDFDGIAAGSIGTLSVGGGIFGGAGFASGQIATNSGSIRSLRVGWLVGGTGDASGTVSSAARMEDVRIVGGLNGGAGRSSGAVFAGGAGIRNLVVRGSILGGTNDDSGSVQTAGRIGSARIDGSIIGGAGLRSGRIEASQGIGSMRIGGDIEGGSNLFSGSVAAAAGRIGRLDVRSIVSNSGLYGGSVTAANLGAVNVRGDVVGSFTRKAVLSAAGTSGQAIGSLTVRGSVADALILGGYDVGTPVNGNARIGSVDVRGNLRASSIVSGVVNPITPGQWGNRGDAPIGGVGASRIGSVTVRGQASGNLSPGDSFGVVAGSFGRIRLGGTTFATPPGSITFPSGDNLAIHRL